MKRLTTLAIWLTIGMQSIADDALPLIPRRIPPQGVEMPESVRKPLQETAAKLRKDLEAARAHPLIEDVEIFVKAVDFALRHGEFYSAKDFPRATKALELARKRLTALKAGDTPWTKQRGLIVRGFRSSIDGSVQPYGLVVPKDLKLDKPVPLYVWLHGRGDKVTDLHFIHRRLSGPGNVHPANAITLHPFGRQCIGYKSTGEIDVLEAITHVRTQYKIDPNRIVLMGFSMGGAGAWHVGAHYADRWAAVSPGAGFAETAQYNKLTIDELPPVYEQRLWKLYDVPNYVRNLFNLPVIAYSGEKDKQIQAARVMEAAFLAHGKKLPHLIGPGMGHRYHPDTLKELLGRIDEAVKVGRNPSPKKVHLQTRTLRYNRMHWVALTGLENHWVDSRVDAEMIGPRELKVITHNIRSLQLTPWKDMAAVTIQVDGQTLKTPADFIDTPLELENVAGRWRAKTGTRIGLEKRPGLQGPIDDVLMAPFLVVTPSAAGFHKHVDRWVNFELAHFQARWRALYRGELRIKKDVELTPDDIKKYHLILWGDASSNKFLAGLLAEQSTRTAIPLAWNKDTVSIYGHQASASRHVPVFIYPNPINTAKYIVINSGPTHREGHDRTNSLQNPKLPDWTLLNIDNPPTAAAAGKVLAAGFFGENWE